MKAYPDKYHLLLSESDSSKTTIGSKIISSSKCEKLSGIEKDNNLNFEEHIESLCKNTSQKVNALSRLASSRNYEQRRLLMNSFVICHFSYYPVMWIFHSRKLNGRINRLHERALRIVYKDFDSSFEELLTRDSSTTLHQRNLRQLITEIFNPIQDWPFRGCSRIWRGPKRPQSLTSVTHILQLWNLAQLYFT